MKTKLFVGLILSFLTCLLVGCTTFLPTMYNGPYFLGLGGTTHIPNDAAQTSSLLNISDEVLEISQEYRTTKNAEEYLIVFIEQPAEVEDQFVISSITLEYPSGSKIKWTNSTQEPVSNRKWHSNVHNTMFFIPITAPNEISQEGFIYTVTAIQYIDGLENKDVRFVDDASDYITLFVVNRKISFSGMNPHYNPSSKVITLAGYDSIDDVTIQKIYVNNILAIETNVQYENNDHFTIPQSVSITTQGWVKLTFEFEDGIGGTMKQDFLATNYNLYNPGGYDVFIRSGAELDLIPKDHIGEVYIIQNIVINSSFIPFTSSSFSITGSGTNSITCNGTVLLWDYQHDPMNPSEWAAFNLRDINIIGTIEMINRAPYDAVLFAYANRDHFSLTNIIFYYLGPLQLSFNTMGGNTIAPYVYKADTSISAPPTPVKDGFTFVGWYHDELCLHPFTFNIMPSENKTIFAKWNALSTTITFEPNGGSLVDPILQEVESEVLAPIDPTKEGFVFGGWFVDLDCTIIYEFNTMPTEDITVYAKWNVPLSTITFESNGDSLVDPISQEIGSVVLAPVEPTKDGFTFVGWFIDTDFIDAYIFDMMPDKDITLYAKWDSLSSTITFESNGGSLVDPISQEAESVVLAPVDPTKDGFTFVGWFIDTDFINAYIFDLMPDDDITLYAKWDSLSPTITFESNGGSLIVPISQEIGSVVLEPVEPTKDGFTFVGWFIDSGFVDAYTFDLMPNEDITLYAKWNVPSSTITFESNGGSLIVPIVQEIGSVVLEPVEPTKDGFTFDGWFIDSDFINAYIFDLMPDEDITLYAKWASGTYTLTFDSGGGSLVEVITGAPGTVIEEPLQPVKEGHEFMGWFEDFAHETPYIFDTLTKTCTLYAKWDLLQYSVSFYEYENLTYKYITIGREHVIALTDDNRLLSWGLNNFGQLGDGTATPRYVSVDITSSILLASGEVISGLGAGVFHSLAFTSNNRVFTWGSNYNGQCGPGYDSIRTSPIEITSAFTFEENETIIKIEGGELSSSLLTNLGNVWSWGNNAFGQIGDGTNTTRIIPVKITTFFTLTEENEIIKDISLGYRHAIALSSAGKVFTWGDNQYYKLGDGTQNQKRSPYDITYQFPYDSLGKPTATQVYAMPNHNFVVTSTNRVFGFGMNDRFQLGIGSPMISPTIHEVMNASRFVAGHTVKSISGSVQYSVLVMTDGRTFGWGYGMYSQFSAIGTLSTPYQFNHRFPLQAGEMIDYVDGGENMAIYHTSLDRIFILGFRYINMQQTSPIGFDFESTEDIQEISSHENHALVLTTDGRLFSWGDNTYGQIGDGMWGSVYNRFQPVNITNQFALHEGEYFTSIATGKIHSLASTSEGRVFAWGGNAFGTLGDGTMTTREVPIEITNRFNISPSDKIVKIFAGYEHSMAISELGAIYVWGSNQYGQLGLGSSATYFLGPTQVNYGLYHGFSSGESITSLILNRHTTYAITSLHRVLVWGANSNGILGTGDQNNSYIPLNITPNFGLLPDEYVIQIGSGINHAIALTSFGRVYTWGLNDYGQLGVSTLAQSNLPVDITGFISFESGSKIIKIEVSPNGCVAITDIGKVFVWGHNLSNMLGTTNVVSITTAVEVSANFALPVNEIFSNVNCGYQHCIFLTSKHRVFTKGSNSLGALGWGDFSVPYLVILKDFVIKDTVFLDYGSTIQPMVLASRSFYSLVEWYEDKDLMNLNEVWMVPNENIKLYAKWKN